MILSSAATGRREGKLRPGASTVQAPSNSRKHPPLTAHSFMSPIMIVGAGSAQAKA